MSRFRSSRTFCAPVATGDPALLRQGRVFCREQVSEQLLVEGSAKGEHAARLFATKVNRASAIYLAQQDADT